jgi:prepilin-type N-terminal cleavage/methylation domain-containing protein
MRRFGFTLIELLVVISIISILAGAVTVVIGIAKRASTKAKTDATIAKLQVAIGSYRQLQGFYPGDKDTPPPASGWRSAPTKDWTKLYETQATGGTMTAQEWADVSVRLADELVKVNEVFETKTDVMTITPTTPGTPGLLDGSKISLRYRPARFYPFTAGAPNLIDSDNPPNRDSYQLWSVGYDQIDQFGETTKSDDQVNWGK